MTKNHKIVIEFENNRILPVVFGHHNDNIIYIEQELNTTINNRGGVLYISGHKDDVTKTRTVVDFLYNKAIENNDLKKADVETAIRFCLEQKKLPDDCDSSSIVTPKKTISSRSPKQIEYIDNMQKNTLSFGIGPAGTGKTYLAVAQGISMLSSGLVDKIIITRPVVEAGENLGFLPGDLKEKVDPYLRPIYDAFYDCMDGEIVNRKLENNDIEIAPLAYMRGRTLKNAFVILDEAQNTTTMQMKMFLTRLGQNTKMVITGDISQVDLAKNVDSGLVQAMNILSGIDDISISLFTSKDVVRHKLVGEIVKAYEHKEKKSSNKNDK